MKMVLVPKYLSKAIRAHCDKSSLEFDKPADLCTGQRSSPELAYFPARMHRLLLNSSSDILNRHVGIHAQRTTFPQTHEV